MVSSAGYFSLGVRIWADEREVSLGLLSSMLHAFQRNWNNMRITAFGIVRRSRGADPKVLGCRRGGGFGLFGHGSKPRGMGCFLAHRDGILAALTIRRGVGNDDGAVKGLPILRRELIERFHSEVL